MGDFYTHSVVTKGWKKEDSFLYLSWREAGHCVLSILCTVECENFLKMGGGNAFTAMLTNRQTKTANKCLHRLANNTHEIHRFPSIANGGEILP